MNIFAMLKLGDIRKEQWTFEENFDEIIVPKISKQCSKELIINFLLMRSKLNRDLSLKIKNAPIHSKNNEYNKYIMKINEFNSEIDELKTCNDYKKFIKKYC
jgi:hypothetical protein